jgi:hypothetical protein
MAGTLKISTLNDDTGVLATQNGMRGIAKAWVQFTGSTGAANGSFNISSVVRNSAGYYTFNFTTAMPNTNYAVCASASPNNGTMDITTINAYSSNTATVGTYTTSSFNAVVWGRTTAQQDTGIGTIVVFSA